MTAHRSLRVGLVGYGFMGRAHSHAWRSVASFFDVPVRPALVAICGRNADAVGRAASTMGWDSSETDWRRLVERDDIDLIDICTPGSSHAPIAITALAAGKHVLCEKPLANTVDEAQAMADAAGKAAAIGVRSMVGFNYRRVPAIELARRLVADGRLGAVRHVRAQYLQDWAADPELPLVWRLRADEAGAGSLGDLASHIIDLAEHLTHQRITSVSGLTETFIKERADAGREGHRGVVDVDDAALGLARFDGGALGTFEATRFAAGRKNALRIEVNGSSGSLAFDLEQLNELQFFDSADRSDAQGFRRVLVTEPEHPWFGAWWPAGHIIGWEHSFTHEISDLLDDIAADRDPTPSFVDGLHVQRVLAALSASADRRCWEDL